MHLLKGACNADKFLHLSSYLQKNYLGGLFHLLDQGTCLFCLSSLKWGVFQA